MQLNKVLLLAEGFSIAKRVFSIDYSYLVSHLCLNPLRCISTKASNHSGCIVLERRVGWAAEGKSKVGYSSTAVGFNGLLSENEYKTLEL